MNFKGVYKKILGRQYIGIFFKDIKENNILEYY